MTQRVTVRERIDPAITASLFAFNFEPVAARLGLAKQSSCR
jgi:hypothetical protein